MMAARRSAADAGQHDVVPVLRPPCVEDRAREDPLGLGGVQASRRRGRGVCQELPGQRRLEAAHAAGVGDGQWRAADRGETEASQVEIGGKRERDGVGRHHGGQGQEVLPTWTPTEVSPVSGLNHLDVIAVQDETALTDLVFKPGRKAATGTEERVNVAGHHRQDDEPADVLLDRGNEAIEIGQRAVLLRRIHQASKARPRDWPLFVHTLAQDAAAGKRGRL